MATRREVEEFLSQFKVKLEVWGIVFLDGREKNMKALADINITPVQRLKKLRLFRWNIILRDLSETY